MPIDDPTPTTAGAPVLSRRAIGQKFKGVTCLMPESRDRMKYDKETQTSSPMLKPNGKARQELVVTMLTIGSSMPTGKIDEPAIPVEGDVVRVILKGKSFGDWIEAADTLGRKIGVGFIVEMDTTVAQAYDENGGAKGAEITTQDAANAVPRGVSLGFYGPVRVGIASTPDEIAWDTKACQFYNDSQRPEPVGVGAGATESDVF